MSRKLACILILGVAVSASCGKSGDRETRPIEVAFRVTRPSGVQFIAPAIQAGNADHRFADRIFDTPQLFVLENALQPVAGFFKNLDPTLPMTVELYFGTQLVKIEQISPGVCCTVSLDSECSQATETCAEPSPVDAGVEVRFEVFSISGAANIGLSATLGDELGTNITACAAESEICRTPAIFFLEEASGFVSGIFNKLSDQDPDAVMEAELYVDGDRRDSGTDKKQIVLSHDL